MSIKSDIYIHLFHGRSDPTEHMDSWGEDGPTVGPFQWLHATYLSTFNLGNDDHTWSLDGGSDSLVYYDGMYYGDFDIVGKTYDVFLRAEEFDPSKAERRYYSQT